MKRGVVLGAMFGIVASLALWTRVVIEGGFAIGFLLGSPVALLTDLLWIVAFTVAAGVIAEQANVLPGESAEDTEDQSRIDQGMQEFDP